MRQAKREPYQRANKSIRIYNYVLSNCSVKRQGNIFKATIEICGRRYVEVAEKNYLASRKLANEISISKHVQRNFPAMEEQLTLF